MRKARAGGLGLTAILALLAVTGVALGGDDRQDLERLQFTTEKPDKATGIKFKIDFGDPEPDQAVERMVTVFENGTEYDFRAPRLCRASDQELEAQGAEACPARSIVGDGAIRAEAAGMEGAADATLLNNRNEVILLSELREAPGVRFADRARVDEEERKFVVNTPDEFSLQRVRLEVDRVTEGGDEYLKTPDSCPNDGDWVNKVKLKYRDGFEDKEREESPCV